jgi:hypothetical protein
MQKVRVANVSGDVLMSTDAKKEAVRVSRRVECVKTVPMPDIYADEGSAEDTNLKDIEALPPNVDETPAVNSSNGFNPYDTGVLYKK